VRLTLYSKPACCLCDEAKGKIERLKARGYDLTLDERDITTDAVLFERFRYVIPVVELPDGTVLVAPISEYKLEKAITQAVPDAQ
jgi:hypothetical protein